MVFALRAESDTSPVTSIPVLMVELFAWHLEEQQSKIVALAGGLHRRLGAESVVSRLDGDLLEMIWEQVEQRSVVPPVEEKDSEESVEEDESSEDFEDE